MINFSEILWKPQQAAGARSSVSIAQPSESFEETSELRRLPAEDVRMLPESRIVMLTNPQSPGANRFRLLRMRLRELKDAVNLRTLLITSPLPQDGKSTIVLNLATALAEQGKRTVLVLEGDLYHPTLTQSLGLQIRPGLAECLEDGLDPMLALRRLEPLGWYLLPAGTARGNPTELLQSESLSSVMQKLSPHFDWILIDSPPVAPLADAISLSRYVDASMLVVRADRTPQEAVKHALTLLGPKHVLGIVFNAAEGLNRAYSDYYGHYSKK
jgi:capsular exopolysaccharide synthesis family protein